MNLNRFFTFLYFITFCALFFSMGIADLSDSLDFVLYGAHRVGVIVTPQTPDADIIEDSEVEEISTKTSEVIYVRYEYNDSPVIKEARIPFMFSPRIGSKIPVLVMGRKNYVRIDSFKGLFLQNLFFLVIAAVTGMACFWTLKTEPEKQVEATVSLEDVRPTSTTSEALDEPFETAKSDELIVAMADHPSSIEFVV